MANAVHDGVWEGTIGTHPILACFEDHHGEYYYKEHADRSLRLSQESGQWREEYGGTTGFWMLEDAAPNDAMHGQWANAKKVNPLPISLHSLTINPDEKPCSSHVFVTPQWHALKLEITKVTTFHGHEYRPYYVKKGGVGGFEIMGTSSNIAFLNWTILDDVKNQMRQGEECVNAEGRLAFSANFKPIFWNNRWISIEMSSEYDCGAHPEAGIDITTYNLQTAKPVDLWTWFDQTDQFSALTEFVLQFAKGKNDPGCLDVLHEHGLSQIWLHEKGMVFYTQLPHVEAACSEEILIPFNKLTPFLNVDGKAHIALLKKKD